MFTKLKLKDWLTLFGVIVIVFGWLLIDQFFLAETFQRFIALFLIILGLFYLQFMIIKPESPIRYANTIAIICFSFIVATTFILHFIIKNDFTSKLVLMWIVSGVVPYFAGGLYSLTREKA
jgi:hypothetical protein